jgi:ubiquinone/menaquinone biosynthesis C-methylase UbiE
MRVKRDILGKSSELAERKVTKYWDGNADLWTDHVRQGWDTYREYLNNPAFLKFIGNLKGKKVLDAGCGEGYNTRILARKGARVVGVDISSKMIRHARQTERRGSLGIRYEVTSFSNLSLSEDVSFDTVVSTMALMDGPDYAGAIKEFFRVLRPHGDLFFSITHPCFMTRGFGWVANEKDEPVKLTVSDYFRRRPYVERWHFSQLPDEEKVKSFAVPSFPRTLSDYLNTLIETGFVLKRIHEPRPSAKTCRQYPWLKKWRDIAALFFYVHAEKP